MDEPISLEGRVERLEARAQAVEDARDGDERLVTGVERLAEETNGLNAVLTRVDEQQVALARLERDKASKVEVEEVDHKVDDAVGVRKKAMRRLHITVGSAVVLCVASVIGGAWLTDKHLQDCVLHGPNTSDERLFCDTTFPGHDHPEDISLDALLLRGQISGHRACLNVNRRTQALVDKERAVLIGDVIPEVRAARLKYIEDAESLIQDCDKTNPLPKGVS